MKYQTSSPGGLSIGFHVHKNQWVHVSKLGKIMPELNNLYSPLQSLGITKVQIQNQYHLFQKDNCHNFGIVLKTSTLKKLIGNIFM